MRLPLSVVILSVLVACSSGKDAPPTTPSPPPSPPASLFAVSGYVHDTIGRPLSEARVEATSGSQLGTAVTTDAAGRYAFDAVFAEPVVLRASKAGYHEQSLSIAHAQAPRFFKLDSANGSLSLGGYYALTFVADSSCTNIPGYARRRVYDAVSAGQSSSFYLMTLSGGGYGITGSGYFSNVLYASVFEQTAQVNLNDPPIWERFPQGSYVVIYGGAQGVIRELPATLSMWGLFSYCPQLVAGSEPRCAVPEITCESSNHRLTIDRR